MIDKCCYNKDLCSLFKCQIHSRKVIMAPTLRSNGNLDVDKTVLHCNVPRKICNNSDDEALRVHDFYGRDKKYDKLKIEMLKNGKSIETKNLGSLKLKAEFMLVKSEPGQYDELKENLTTSIGKNEYKNKVKNENEVEVEHVCNRRLLCKSDSLFEKSLSSSSIKHRVPASNASNPHKNCSMDEMKTKRNSYMNDDSSSLFSEVKFGTVYTCHLCEYVFSNKYSLAKHKRKHNFCQYCKTKFKSFKALSNHKKNCNFEKCLKSCPKVNLSNIAFSKKIRSLYHSTFNRNKFPPFESGSVFTIKEECVDSKHSYNTAFICEKENLNPNLANNISVKSEPSDYEYNEYSEIFYEPCNHIKNDSKIQKFVKTEVMDIVEEQLVFDNELDINQIKKENIDIADYSLNWSGNQIKSNSSVIKTNENREVHPNNIQGNFEDEDLSETGNEENKAPRFCRFTSEMNDLETELKYTEPIEIKNELNVLKPIKSEFMDTTLVGNNIKLFDHGKRTTKLSITNSEMNLKTKDPFMKKISNDFFNTVSNSKFESKLALSELGNIKRCKQCSLLGMNHKDILECSKLQKRIGDGESVISETANNDKTAVSPRVRYIRLTNEPNLNLFLP